MKRCLSISLFAFSVGYLNAQKDSLLKIKVKLLDQKLDTITKLFNDEVIINKKYSEIVEKTNNNLSLNWTPLNTTISVIGIFCAIFSILTFAMAFGSRQEVGRLLKKKKKEFDDDVVERLLEVDEIISERLKNKSKPETEFLETVDNKLNSVINLIKKTDK